MTFQGVWSFLLFVDTFCIQRILSFLMFLDTFGKGWKVNKLYYKGWTKKKPTEAQNIPMWREAYPEMLQMSKSDDN